MSAEQEIFAAMFEEASDGMSIAEQAQYIADHIDASILLALTQHIPREEAFGRAPEMLAREGWAGRRYEYINRPDGKAWWPRAVIREATA